MLERDVEAIVNTYGSMLYRICVVNLGNESDAEDAVQETFIRYVNKAPAFESDEHEKAWLIRVAMNICRDMLRFRFRHPVVDTSFLKDVATTKENSYVREALMEIPEKYREVMLLYYVEEYKIDEIAGIIGKTPSAVKMRLAKGRQMLAEKYREEYL